MVGEDSGGLEDFVNPVKDLGLHGVGDRDSERLQTEVFWFACLEEGRRWTEWEAEKPVMNASTGMVKNC